MEDPQLQRKPHSCRGSHTAAGGELPVYNKVVECKSAGELALIAVRLWLL